MSGLDPNLPDDYAPPSTTPKEGTMTIDIDTLTLARGAHSTPSDGMCLLEAAAYMAGEPHSDHPTCVCPVLAAFGRAWNDGLGDEARNHILKPFLPRLLNTRSTPDVQDRRAFMAADWAVRTYAPAWLRLAGLNEHADALSGLPELDSVQAFLDAQVVIQSAKRAAFAAGDAAGAAAGDAAGAAAGDAAGDAAGAAAWAAAGDAAGAAAWAAAWAAARAAAWAALAPTRDMLQASAADLFDRMIGVA
jgi:hypothetical protein